MKFTPPPAISFAALVILASLGIGCEDVHGSAQLSGGNHRKAQYKVQFDIPVLRFLAPGTPVPAYNLIVDGYPSNRILVQAYTVATNPNTEAQTITPMQLNAGTQIPLTITVGPDVYTYTATLTSVSSLPAGTYLLDAPGAVQDVQASLEANPGATVQFSISGLGQGGIRPLPSAGSTYIGGDTGSTNLVMDVDAAGTSAWSQLQTAYKPGPVQIQ